MLKFIILYIFNERSNSNTNIMEKYTVDIKPITITAEDLAFNKPVFDGARIIGYARSYRGPKYDGARFVGYW